MGERVRQNERPEAGPGETAVPPPPIPDQARIIDDVDVERARSPWPASAAPRSPFNGLYNSEQSFRRQVGRKRCDRIHVSRLLGVPDWGRLVKRRDGEDVDIGRAHFA